MNSYKTTKWQAKMKTFYYYSKVLVMILAKKERIYLYIFLKIVSSI